MAEVKKMNFPMFPLPYYTTGEVINLDKENGAAIEYIDKDDNKKTFSIENARLKLFLGTYFKEIGDKVSLEIVGSKIYVHKSSGNPLFPP